MLKTLSKEVRQARFLYIGIVLLLIIALILVLALFYIPSSPFGKNINQPRPPVNLEQVRELLSAPAANKPAQIPQTQLNNLEGTKQRVVPTQEMMNLLSAPPQK